MLALEEPKFKYTGKSWTLIQVLRLVPHCFLRRTFKWILQDLFCDWTPILITQHFSDLCIWQFQLLWKIWLFLPEGCTSLEGFKKVLHWRERNAGSIMKEVSEGSQNQKFFHSNHWQHSINNAWEVISYIYVQSWIHTLSNPHCRLHEA